MPSPFNPSLVKFLRALAKNNNREWFTAHKAQYEEEVQQPALAFIEAMAPRLRKISKHVRADARKAGGSLMRIYRDTRFSREKTPYKTNVGIQFRHEEGKDVHAPGFYFHIEPGSYFLGAGMWHPEREALNGIRDAIDANGKAWVAARDDRKFTKGWTLEGDSLRRAPAGYPVDHPLIEDLRRTDFIAVQELDEKDLYSPKLADNVAAAYADTVPFMKFLCGAVDVKF